jgi:hypothetical protein
MHDTPIYIYVYIYMYKKTTSYARKLHGFILNKGSRQGPTPVNNCPLVPVADPSHQALHTSDIDHMGGTFI